MTGSRRSALAWLLMTLAGTCPAADLPDGWPLLASGTAVLIRHAQAPGVGDPPGMTLDDCSTQRNLDDVGRAQARAIGEQFRNRGVAVGRVLSSQWCRTRETARLAFGPGVADAPAFNSAFSRRDDMAAQTAAARALLLDWRGPGVLVVVTHQVNISALTGLPLGSGEALVLRRQGDALRLIGSLAFGPR